MNKSRKIILHIISLIMLLFATPLPAYGNGVLVNDFYKKEIIEESNIFAGNDSEDWIDENDTTGVAVIESEIFTQDIYELEGNNKNEYDTEEDIEEISEIQDVSGEIVQSGGFPETNEKTNLFKIKRYAASGATENINLSDGYDKIAAALTSWDGESREIEVDVSEHMIPAVQAKRFITTAINLHPECFIFAGSYRYYSTVVSGTKYVKSFLLAVDRSYTLEDQKTFNNKVNEIISAIDPSWSNLQKIIYIHDYLVTHIDYDTTYKKYNAYNALVEENVVCQGYSLAYAYLLNNIDAGYDCQIVTSNAINHAWNMVTYDGYKYYIDATWDDPTNRYSFYNSYANFMVSQSKLHANHRSDDWLNAYGDSIYDNVNTSDDLESLPWSGMHSAMPMYGNVGVYYKGHSPMRLYKYDFNNGSSTEIASYNGAWKVWNNGNTTYTDCFSSLMRYGEYIIISTPNKILVVDMDGKTKRTYDSQSDAGYIYGASINGRIVRYDVHTAPGISESIYAGRFTQSLDDLPSVRIKGDLTGDGIVAMNDVVKAARAVAGSVILTDEEKEAADVTGDKIVAMGDVVKLSRYVSGTIKEL